MGKLGLNTSKTAVNSKFSSLRIK